MAEASLPKIYKVKLAHDDYLFLAYALIVTIFCLISASGFMAYLGFFVPIGLAIEGNLLIWGLSKMISGNREVRTRTRYWALIAIIFGLITVVCIGHIWHPRIFAGLGAILNLIMGILIFRQEILSLIKFNGPYDSGAFD